MTSQEGSACVLRAIEAVSAMAEREAALRSEVEALRDLLAENVHLKFKLSASKREVEALRADAERYQWLCSQARMDPDMGGNHRWHSIYLRGNVRGPTLDSAIDAARAEARDA